MARINVEDDLFKDRRWMDLVVEMKSAEAAMGAVVLAWIVAQRFWKYSDNGIPKAEWEKQRLRPELIKCGMAEDRGDFVFIVGSETHFAWIRQKVHAGEKGGVESGKARQEIIDESPKRSEAKRSAGKRSEPSSSSSFSFSSSFSNSNSDSEEKTLSPGVQAPAVAVPKKSRPQTPTKPTWEAYAFAYHTRYGTDPVRNATINSQISQFVRRVGESEAPLVAEFYLTHNDAFYVRTMHSVGAMLRDAEKLRTEWKTGRTITQGQARQADKKQTNLSVFEKLIQESRAKEQGHG